MGISHKYNHDSDSPKQEAGMKLCGKELKILATAGWDAEYGGTESLLYIRDVMEALKVKPVDMLVFEMADPKHLQVRSAGHDLTGETIPLDEKTILGRYDSLDVKTFWFKIDDYGDHFVGTFLFPSEY